MLIEKWLLIVSIPHFLVIWLTVFTSSDTLNIDYRFFLMATDSACPTGDMFDLFFRSAEYLQLKSQLIATVINQCF